MSKQAFTKIADDMHKIVLLQIQGNDTAIAELRQAMKLFYIENVAQTAENAKIIDDLFRAARGQNPYKATQDILDSVK